MTWDFERIQGDPNKYIKGVRRVILTPLLPGMRVCLNPESKEYPKSNAIVKGFAGYVIHYHQTTYQLISWNKLSDTQKNDTMVVVKFDNNNTMQLRFRELILVDTPPKTIYDYILSNNSKITIIEGDSMVELDNLIFKNGLHIKSKEIIDEDWRKNMMTAINL